MSKSARRLHRGKPIDRVVHPKTGRRKGEKQRQYMAMPGKAQRFKPPRQGHVEPQRRLVHVSDGEKT